MPDYQTVHMRLSYLFGTDSNRFGRHMKSNRFGAQLVGISLKSHVNLVFVLLLIGYIDFFLN